MTADTHVHEEGEVEVPSNSEAPLQIQADPSGLDASSYQDLHQFPAPDCNGCHLGGEDPDRVIVRDDADDENSDVFITGKDDPLSIHNDLKDNAQVFDGSKATEIQNQEFGKSPAPAEDKNWVLEATEVASPMNAVPHLDSTQNSQGDAFTEGVPQQSGTITVADSEPQQLGSLQIDSRPTSAATGNQESLGSVLVLGADSGDHPQQESALEFSSESNFFNEICREDKIVSISESGLGKESGHASLEATVTIIKSPQADISHSNPEARQISQFSSHLRGTQDFQTLHLVECASQQTEVQTVHSKEQSNAESACVTEAQESQSRSSDLNDDGVQLQEETKSDYVSNEKGDLEIKPILGENGQSNENKGLKIEESEHVVNLPSGKETSCGLVLNENTDHIPTSFVSNDVSETKESNPHANDCENPLEFQQSSESSDSLVLASACVRKETNNGDDSVESVENIPDVTRQQEGKHEAPSSPCRENVVVNTSLITKPETEHVTVESIENIPDVTRQQEGKHEAPPSPRRENVVVNTSLITKPETEHVTVESVENSLKEHEIQCKPPSQFEIVAATTKQVIGKETEVETVENFVPRNLDGAFSPPVNEVKLEGLKSKDVDITSFSGDDKVAGSLVNGMGSKNELGTAEPEVEMITFRGDDVHTQTKGSDMSSRVSTCNDVVVSENEGFDSSVVINENLVNFVAETVDLENKGKELSGADINSDDKLIHHKSKDELKSHSNEMSTSLSENPSGQDVTVEPLTRPFQFLIRIPKFDSLKFRDQIRQAQLLVEEKTRLRDAFRQEIQNYKANCRAYAVDYEAAVSKLRALKRSVKSKRAEIDSLQSVINKVKNAISVEDIDARIYNMEHMIEHETLPLKEEKQFIREIKQLKQLREQLSSNIGSQDEVLQALNKRDQIEEHLKILKKELDSLKDSVLKADTVARAIEKKYEDENKKVKEVQAQFQAADTVRQTAYAHFQSLRKEVFEKNQQFRMYKEKAAAASDYASKRDREALHHLCVNQVETIMELWNKNDEFRKEYIQCNMRNTLKRLGTLDGRSLGPLEEPPVLDAYGDERVKDRMVSYPAEPKFQVQILEQENLVRPIEGIEAVETTKAKDTEPKSQPVKSRKQEKPSLGNVLPTVSGSKITDETREKENLPTEEGLELARKAEELRKEEAAAKLKEQRRLEEKAKALEALERKKRNAEKAQMKAELRAQKEAEQREKEREKRLRKKERKRISVSEIPDGDNNGETTPRSEISTEKIKEPGIIENPLSVPKRPQKPSQFTKQSKTKSIPPPLRNRHRRKIQQWMWIILTCLLVIILFLLGNIGFFSNLSNLRRRSSGY